VAFAHGSKASLSVNATDISTYLKSTGLSRSIDEADTTTLQPAGSHKSSIPGLIDDEIPLEGLFDPAVDAAINTVIAGGALVAFIYGPQGTTTGNVKYSGNGYFTKYEVKSGTDGAGSITGTFKASGAVTRGVF